jgi:predicted ATPase
LRPESRIYEVRLQRTPDSPEVAFTDIGFGVSQVLPVITLCYYVPERSILILEQPEIHLHPTVQMALADAIIDAVKTRSIQVIIESHSEHFLLRLQRRIAEGVLSPKDTASTSANCNAANRA